MSIPVTSTTDRPPVPPALPPAVDIPAAKLTDPFGNEPPQAQEAKMPVRVLKTRQEKRGWRANTVPDRPEIAEVGSRFLYVAEQGTVLRRSGTRVVITRKEQTLLAVPAVRLQGVLVYGNVQVSTQCVRNLLSEGVYLSFFTRNGQYRGRLQPPVERGGRLRRRQWDCSANPAFCLKFSKAVVRGKILSAQRMAQAYARNRAAESLGSGHLRLRVSLAKIKEASDVATLRGIEGGAARAYFDLFRRWNRSELEFERREKRGTSNRVNALLNFGYTLLTREVEGLLEAAGLDPTIGFYHLSDDDRPSLACDWVEEFRHLVVDRLVLTLINKRMLTAAHFEDGDDRRGVRMNLDGIRVFCSAYERAMRRPVGDDEEGPGTTIGFRSVLLAQLGRLLDATAGRAPYLTHLEELPAATPDGDMTPVPAPEASSASVAF